MNVCIKGIHSKINQNLFTNLGRLIIAQKNQYAQFTRPNIEKFLDSRTPHSTTSPTVTEWFGRRGQRRHITNDGLFAASINTAYE